MRNVYLVAYDVTDEKRLRKMFTKMKGFGHAIQYSVFYCELSLEERQTFREAVWDLLEFEQDRVVVADLGPIGGRGDECLEFWGRPREDGPSRAAVIL